MIEAARAKNVIKAALVLAAMIVFAASCIQQAQKSSVPVTSSETPEIPPARVADTTFKSFSHSVPEHKQFVCASCHQREGRALNMEYAGHDSCIGCHFNQFTNADQVICAVCHTAAPPAMKTFPAKFIEGFNMKFDHAAHMQGKGRPADGCAACHSPSGPGESILIGFQSHSTCYACHTAESKIGSCSVCHQVAPYSRTVQSNYSFRAIFRHGDHTARQGVSCSECHSVIAGAPNSRQVTNISILEHRTSPGNNCLQCHNGRRAFTGNNPLDVASCTKCHKGSNFGKLPPDTATDTPAAEAPKTPDAVPK